MKKPDEIFEMRSTSQEAVLIAAHAWNDDLSGGAFRIATELATALADQGFRVAYICCNVNNSPDCEIIRGVEVYRYRMPARKSIIPRVWQHIRCAATLASLLRVQYNIIAVSGHSPLQYAGALAGLGDRASIRCSYVVHSPFADEQLATAGSKGPDCRLRVRAFAGAMIDGWCLHRSDAVQCLSRFTTSLLMKQFGSRLRTRPIERPGWVDTARFQPSSNRHQHRARLPSPWHTNDPVLFTLRRLESRMGLDTLIEAAAKTAGSHRFRMLIGGTGPEASRLQESIRVHGLQDRVFLLGRIPEEQLPDCYAAADVFVLPTRSLECFGLILLEAFSTNTPVIASRVGAIPELLDRLGDDWMFQPGNSDELAARITQFLDNGLTSTVNLREIAEDHDIQRVIPEWVEVCLGSRENLSVVAGGNTA